jgi:hypothetical protein
VLISTTNEVRTFIKYISETPLDQSGFNTARKKIEEFQKAWHTQDTQKMIGQARVTLNLKEAQAKRTEQINRLVQRVLQFQSILTRRPTQNDSLIYQQQLRSIREEIETIPDADFRQIPKKNVLATICYYEQHLKALQASANKTDIAARIFGIAALTGLMTYQGGLPAMQAGLIGAGLTFVIEKIFSYLMTPERNLHLESITIRPYVKSPYLESPAAGRV